MIKTFSAGMRKSNAGFSLVELLVVMGIIGLMTTLGTMAFSSVTGGSRLSQGTSLIIDNIRLARQSALANNSTVELRFYKLPDNQGSRFKALRLISIDSEGNEKALDRMQMLPDELQLVEADEYSTILNESVVSRSGSETLASGVIADYVGFRFKSNGLTDLKPDESWFVTVQFAKQNDELASNYSTVQINPVTGAATLYRP